MGRGRGERRKAHTHKEGSYSPSAHTHVLLPTRLDLYSAFALYALALAPSRCDDFWLEVWNYLG